MFVFAAIAELSVPPNAGCACSGDILIYSCTAIGAGNTLWEGSAFACVGNSIILRHSQFGVGVSGECNDGNIVARSVDITNNCYTSQLSFRVSPTFNSKTIKCSHDSTMGIKDIGSSTLAVLEGQFIIIVVIFMTFSIFYK